MIKYIHYANWIFIIYIFILVGFALLGIDHLFLFVMLVNCLFFINSIICIFKENERYKYKKLYELQNKRLRKENINNIIKKI